MIRALTAGVVIAGVYGVAAAPLAVANGYPNGTAAHAAGRYNIPQGDPEYKASQDRDGDGLACEGRPPRR